MYKYRGEKNEYTMLPITGKERNSKQEPNFFACCLAAYALLNRQPR